MRASRLLSILVTLQARGRVTATQLADQLEVSVRTVYRDVEALSAAGIPVYAERGALGGYRLLGGYRTTLTGLTPDEAEALALAGLPGPAAELGLGAELAAAQLKLAAALSPALRERAAAVQAIFHLDTDGWFHDDPVPLLPLIADALWTRRRLHVRYRTAGSRGRHLDRVLDPLGLVLKGGLWYLVGRHDAASIRTYRVSRISTAVALDGPEGRFERPDGFDLAAVWRDRVRDYHQGLFTGQMVVRLSPEGMAQLPYAVLPQAWRAAEVGDTDQDGWVTVTMPLESVGRALAEMLRLGAEAEVISPPELRAMMTETINSMARVYRDR